MSETSQQLPAATHQPVSAKIRTRIIEARQRYHANDNIAAFLEPGDLYTDSGDLFLDSGDL